MRAAQLPLLLLLLAAAAAAAAEEQAAALTGRPALFLHLSDIHFSTNVHGKYWRSFGDREGDAALWATQLVPRLAPLAAVVTGDITDSKTHHGEGLQQEAEWLAYARLLSNLSTAGVPLEQVWDVPGNHDTFNMPTRGGPNDFFTKHAAEGRRRASSQQRVFVHRLPTPGGQQQQQQLEQEQEQQQGGEQGAGPAGSCPAAWMIGIDPTPEPGLRSPTNFAGIARPGLLLEVHAALLRIRRELHPPGCGAPLLLAYSHYPLSTVDSTHTHSAGPPGILLHAAHSALAMQGLTKLLASHNVSAVLSGHLHSSFGQRLHRLHATPAGGYMAELETAAWKDDRRFRLVAVDGGALSFLDLMFHTRNTPRMPRRSDAAAMADTAWQEAYAQRGWAVTAVDPTAAVVEHIAFITSPPDGRYSPLGAPPAVTAAEGQQGQQDGWVRSLVFALDADLAADSAGQLAVELAGYLPGGAQLFSKPMQPAQQAAGSGASGPVLFEASGDLTVSCVGGGGDPAAHCQPPAETVHIQVSVKGASGRVSRSPRQSAALRCAPLTASHQRCWVAAVEGQPLPLGVTLLEWMGLAFNWPVAVHRLFLLAWAFQVGALLLAPRLLGRRVLPHIAASPLLQCHAPTEQQLPSTPRGAAAGSSPTTALVWTGRTLLSYLLWPLAALFLCASVTEVWAALLGYSIYLLVGPWCLYTALSGYPPAMLFHFGVVGRLAVHNLARGAAAEAAAAATPTAAPPAWHFVGTPDTMFVSLVHFTLCLLPVTLWVACVVARRVQLQPYAGSAATAAGQAASRSSSSDSSVGGGDSRRRMEAGGAPSSRGLLGKRSSWGSVDSSASGSGPGSGGRFSFSAPQLAALAGLLAFNSIAVYHKTWSLMGHSALLVSPGLAWTLPLAVLLVCAWGSPRRPSAQLAKGE